MYKEMSFIAYYFHWSEKELMGLDHKERRSWCKEISSINESLNPKDGDGKGKGKREVSILDMVPDSVLRSRVR